MPFFPFKKGLKKLDFILPVAGLCVMSQHAIKKESRSARFIQAAYECFSRDTVSAITEENSHPGESAESTQDRHD